MGYGWQTFMPYLSQGETTCSMRLGSLHGHCQLPLTGHAARSFANRNSGVRRAVPLLTSPLPDGMIPS